MKRLISIIVGGIVLYMLSGQSADPPKKPAATAADSIAASLNHAIHDYKRWTRVSDHAHWAPTLCRMPSAEGAQVSDSQDDGTHGRKLYYLFAISGKAYEQLSKEDDEHRSKRDAAPPGQILVKESFTSVSAAAPEQFATAQPTDRQYPENYAQHDGHWFKTGEFAGLFLMLKLDPATPNSDQGWIYATADAAGKITESGRIAACMKCHIEAKYDRQFGLPYSREKLAATQPAKP